MFKKRKIILIVDDDISMQKITKKLLARNGFETISCLYGEECMERVKVEPPDVILMDVMLPDGDGKEFAKRLKKNKKTKDIPIIFTTSIIDLDDDKGNEVFDINGVLCRAFAKPLHDKKVLSVIRKEINRRKTRGKLPETIRQGQSGKEDG